MGVNKIKNIALLIVILTLAGVWVFTTVKTRQKAIIENAKDSWDYFPAEQIYIGEQLCAFAGRDLESGKKAFKCPDGETYVHKDWR